MLSQHYSHKHAEQTLKAGMKGSRHNVTILSCCTKAWWIWTGMIMRALVFLSCFKAYRKLSECVMYCTVEQVVGEGDRFRQHVYLYAATSSLYASGSGDLCKILQSQTGVILELWLATQTHQAWQCVTLPNTHISRCSRSLFMLEIRCCDGRSAGIHLGLNGCPSMSVSLKNRKEKRTVFFPSICILLSSRGTPLWLWAAPFLVQISETGYPLTQLLCLSSRPVSLGLHFGSGCCVHHSAIKGFHILLASNWGSVS